MDHRNRSSPNTLNLYLDFARENVKLFVCECATFNIFDKLCEHICITPILFYHLLTCFLFDHPGFGITLIKNIVDSIMR